jgi:SAM-dependent methyltransferase
VIELVPHALIERFVNTYLGTDERLGLQVVEVGTPEAGAGNARRQLFPAPRWCYRTLAIAQSGEADILADDLCRWTALGDACVEVIVSTSALHRLEAPWDALREIARVLRPGGLACLALPTARLPPEHGGSSWWVSEPRLRALAKPAGLRAVEVFTAWGLGERHDTFAVLQKPSQPIDQSSGAFPEAVDQGVARRFYLEAFHLRPADTLYYLNVARMMSDAGNLAKARVALKAGLEVAPDHPELRNMLARIDDLENGRIPALQHAISVLSVRPVTAEQVAAAADYFDGASAAERSMLAKSQEKDLAALRRIASVALEARRFPFAASCWERIVRSNRGGVPDLLDWALCTRGAGDLEGAATLFRRARDLQLEFGMLNRTTVVQRLIWKLQATRYLEIGVDRGANLLQIDVQTKLAVDPEFKIPGGAARVEGTRFYQVTSDEFFRAPPEPLIAQGVDIVLIDGLHTADQAFRDLESSLRFLAPRGVIVLHDCLPPSEAAACSDLERARRTPGFDGTWTGDVYRAIVRLRANRSDLFVCVLACDYGIGIVTRGEPESAVQLSEAAIAELSYADLCANREALLNLKPAAWFDRNLDRFG